MKYKLTTTTKVILNITLYQIVALKDFGGLKTGQLGGFIQKESNLSQYDNCWVSGNAQAYGDAQVYGNAQVYGDARVFGDALVSGNARVFGDAQVFGNAQVYGDALVFSDALVFGDALVYGDAQVYGDVQISNFMVLSSGTHNRNPQTPPKINVPVTYTFDDLTYTFGDSTKTKVLEKQQEIKTCDNHVYVHKQLFVSSYRACEKCGSEE